MGKSADDRPLELPRPRRVVNWRGAVKPGRKPTRPGKWVEHVARPTIDQRHPVYVTVPVKPDVPDLTSRKLREAIAAGLEHAATANWERQKLRRRTFRVIHFAVRPARLELLVEASSTSSLARGMQGLSSGLARRVNNAIGRIGSLFSDRYDAIGVSSPKDLRKVLAHLRGDGPELALISEPKTKLLLQALTRR